MFHSLILSILVSFLGMNPKGASSIPRVGIALCNITEGETDYSYPDGVGKGKCSYSGVPITIAILKECGEATLIFDNRWDEYYKDALIVSFLLEHTTWEGSTRTVVSEKQLDGIISQEFQTKLRNAKTGDWVSLTDVKILAMNGSDMVTGRGITYIVSD